MLDVDIDLMRKWWAVLIAVVVVATAIAGSGVAEAAKPGGDRPPDGSSSSYGDAETLQAIDNILSGAQADMANIASGFVATASSAQSQAEFDAMQSMALNEIEAVKKTAEVMLRDIRENGIVTDSFQSLINTGIRISPFIENYTGISNTMLSGAPTSDEVFPDLFRFIDNSVLIAHNASFDRKFLDAEFSRVGYHRAQPFLCSMRVARRLYPKAPDHKLGTLVKYAKVPVTGDFHRALADAEMTALLWLGMMRILRQTYGVTPIELELLQKLEKMTIARTSDWLNDLD
ncbi:MAG: 3'-5' exonuclease [Actinobacteria bacterium]|nr:3'-5' exonuclease [Actinomycetota bacterium]